MLGRLSDNLQTTGDCIDRLAIRAKGFEIIAFNVRFNPSDGLKDILQAQCWVTRHVLNLHGYDQRSVEGRSSEYADPQEH